MGIYLNPGNEQFVVSVNSELYVDKTELIKYTNSRIGKDRPLICSSRPRRFGKTMAVTMLAAYYSKGCHSEKLFEGLQISQNEFFKVHLNKYNVIFLDIQWMYGNALEEMKRDSTLKVVSYIQEQVIAELREEYAEYVRDDDISLPSVLAKINVMTKEQFIIIIDEWDCLFREDKNNENLQKEYINLLRGLFKGTPSGAFLKLAYITGILQIKKYGTQSAMTDFREYTMISPKRLAEYVGFTEKEVQDLCEEYQVSFEEMKRWYDGYYFEGVGHVYNPKALVEAILSEEFENYWTATETYESLRFYIEMNFEGLKDDIIWMLGGNRCRVTVRSFQNDMVSVKNKDDVLTLLIHLGYLAYDRENEEAFIPNQEVADEFRIAGDDDYWREIMGALKKSEQLLKDTWSGNEEEVAAQIDGVHMDTASILNYNDENALSCVISLAYYSARKYYTLVREMPAGKGFADLVFFPRRKYGKNAMVVE